MTAAWGDESIRQRDVEAPMYLMGACICDDDEDFIRSVLGDVKPQRAKKLHWRDMRRSVRKESIKTIASLSLEHIIVLAMPMNQWNTIERARRKCMESLLPLLENEYKVNSFFLESRDAAQDKRDVRFVDAMRSRRFIGKLRVELMPGDRDARLWLPDQLLGAYGDARAGDHAFDEFLSSVRTISVMND